jgi:hypothetical protein
VVIRQIVIKTRDRIRIIVTKVRLNRGHRVASFLYFDKTRLRHLMVISRLTDRVPTLGMLYSFPPVTGQRVSTRRTK